MPQLPEVDPTLMSHEVPGQQSPLIVHVPPELMQVDGAQTKLPSALRTQGTPPQQSDDEAHA